MKFYFKKYIPARLVFSILSLVFACLLNRISRFMYSFFVVLEMGPGGAPNCVNSARKLSVSYSSGMVTSVETTDDAAVVSSSKMFSFKLSFKRSVFSLRVFSFEVNLMLCIYFVKKITFIKKNRTKNQLPLCKQCCLFF